MIRADICMLVDNFATHDARVLKEAASLSYAGWQVILLAVGDKPLGDLPQREERDGFTILRASAPRSRLDRFIWLPLTYILALIGLPVLQAMFMGASRRWTSFGQAAKGLLSQVDARIYHAHDYPDLVILSDGKRRVVYDSHELYFDRHGEVGRNFKSWLVKRKHDMERRVERSLARRASQIITVGDRIAHRLSQTLDLDLPVVVRNAVDLRVESYRVASFPTGRRCVAHSGSLASGRHLVELVRSLQYLPGDVQLVLLGDGPLKRQLEAIARETDTSERLTIIPPVPPAAVASTMSQGDVAVVLTSANPGLNGEYALPNKLFEAVAAGVPLLTGPNVEISDLVRKYDIGVICENPGDPQAIAQVIIQALDPQENERLRNNVMKARQELNWEVEERKLISLYHELLT